ncbi:MAG: hypothetical protein ACK4PR_02275 [Gammaproteobacteria bacterium]
MLELYMFPVISKSSTPLVPAFSFDCDPSRKPQNDVALLVASFDRDERPLNRRNLKNRIQMILPKTLFINDIQAVLFEETPFALVFCSYKSISKLIANNVLEKLDINMNDDHAAAHQILHDNINDLLGKTPQVVTSRLTRRALVIIWYYDNPPLSPSVPKILELQEILEGEEPTGYFQVHKQLDTDEYNKFFDCERPIIDEDIKEILSVLTEKGRLICVSHLIELHKFLSKNETPDWQVLQQIIAQFLPEESQTDVEQSSSSFTRPETSSDPEDSQTDIELSSSLFTKPETSQNPNVSFNIDYSPIRKFPYLLSSIPCDVEIEYTEEESSLEDIKHILGSP